MPVARKRPGIGCGAAQLVKHRGAPPLGQARSREIRLVMASLPLFELLINNGEQVGLLDEIPTPLGVEVVQGV